MKSNIKLLALTCVLLTSCLIIPKGLVAQQSYVSFQLFYDELSPYGEWIDYSDYGYVWIPDVSYDFSPYSTDGRWILTNYGWTWDSDYNWGWAPFHYGRWSYNDSLGWFWVPDTEWGPAWVNWRQYNGYYGWEPMQPGISLSISFGRGYNSNYDHWTFVRERDIERSNIHNYYVSGSRRDRIVRNSVVIRNTFVDNSRHTTYVTGPSRIEIQRKTGRTIVPIRISETNKPGSGINNGKLRIYRPQVTKNENVNRKPAPARIINESDVKHRTDRNNTNQNRIENRNNQPNAVIPQNNPQPIEQRNVNQENNHQPQQQVVPENINQNTPNERKVNNNENRPTRQPEINQQNNNHNPLVKQRPTVIEPENKQVLPERTVAPANPNRNIEQHHTPAVNQPNTNEVKQNRSENPKAKKTESNNRRTRENDQKEK